MQEAAELQAKRDAERSAREAAEAALKADNEERIRRLAAFQALAADRMHKQQACLGPLMVNLKQSHGELTQAENLQVRALGHGAGLLSQRAMCWDGRPQVFPPRMHLQDSVPQGRHSPLAVGVRNSPGWMPSGIASETALARLCNLLGCEVPEHIGSHQVGTLLR